MIHGDLQVEIMPCDDDIIRYDDIPRMTYRFGDRVVFFLNGRIHREDGPAIVWTSGSRAWYKKGLKHRLDGPAVDSSSGRKIWFYEGLYHRLDGPAIIDRYRQFWYQKGVLHRLDGPAVEYKSGPNKWYLNGIEYTEQEHKFFRELV